MSYTPTQWQTGDLISSTNLNKMENGIATGRVVIFEASQHYSSEIQGNYYTTETTPKMILDTLQNNNLPVLKINNGENQFGYNIIDDFMFYENRYFLRTSQTDHRAMIEFVSDGLNISFVDANLQAST